MIGVVGDVLWTSNAGVEVRVRGAGRREVIVKLLKLFSARKILLPRCANTK